jgi:hypothetical protein
MGILSEHATSRGEQKASSYAQGRYDCFHVRSPFQDAIAHQIFFGVRNVKALRNATDDFPRSPIKANREQSFPKSSKNLRLKMSQLLTQKSVWIPDP